MTRSEVKGQLWTGVLTVTFTKKDGTERTITGTQDPSRIPFHKLPISIKEESESNAVGAACPIFDVTLDEWRSFCWDSVKLITSAGGQVWYDVQRDGGLK
jgi:hypothetical protein